MLITPATIGAHTDEKHGTVNMEAEKYIYVMKRRHAIRTRENTYGHKVARAMASVARIKL